jgi:phosphoribosylformylglycinamidine synthase
MKIKVIVTLKDGVLDPQGKAIQQTLNGMNFKNINEVRQGKYFDIEINEKDEAKAKARVEDMCKKLLANLVIEDYKIIETQ